MYRKGVGEGMVGNNQDFEEKYNKLFAEYKRCWQSVNLQQGSAEKIARELMKLVECKLFPPIIPAGFVGIGPYRQRVMLAKKAALLTLRLSDQVGSIWIYKTKYRPVVQVKFFDPLFGVIIESAPLTCPFHSLVNVGWLESKPPLWDFQVKDFCVIRKI